MLEQLLGSVGSCEVQSWQGAALAVFAVVEYWLGKTDKVKAGSTLEAILNGAKKIFSFLKK